MSRPVYPFVPKSSVKLAAGDFWAIPLRNGRFACGRVVEHLPKGWRGSRAGFLGGLLNWEGASEPTFESIAGAKFIAQGIMHILSIKMTGGAILGHRELSLDGLGPSTCIFGNDIQCGFKFVRPFRREDRGVLHSLSWWGYEVIQTHANEYFVERSEKERESLGWLRPDRGILGSSKESFFGPLMIHPGDF